MTTFVVDASVAAKWFIPEPGAEQAKHLLTPRHTLIAPDLLWIDFAKIAWKLVRREMLHRSEAERWIVDIEEFPVEVHESAPLLMDALRLALDRERSVYDCVYLALALRHDAVVITADERLCNALAHTPLAKRLKLLGTA